MRLIEGMTDPRAMPRQGRAMPRRAGALRAAMMVALVLLGIAPGLARAQGQSVDESGQTTYVAEVVEGPIHTIAEEYLQAFNPELIDLPTAELVEKGHPTLTLAYISRPLRASNYANVIAGQESGELADFRTRLGRDFMLSLHAPLLQTSITRSDLGVLAAPGSLTGLGIEFRYLIPYEVAGWRTAIGVRTPTLTTHDEPFFSPDDWYRLDGIYLTTSYTRSLRDRYHLGLSYVTMPMPPSIHQTTMIVPTFGREQNLYDHRHKNFGRWIAEVSYYAYDSSTYGAFGPLGSKALPVLSTGIRVHSGILEIDAFVRRLATDGVSDYRLAMSRRF